MKKHIGIVFLAVLALLYAFPGFAAGKGHKHGKMEDCRMGETCMKETCCPIMIEGVEVTVENVKDGASIMVKGKDAAAVKKIQESAANISKCREEKADKGKKKAGKAKADDEDVICPVMKSKIMKSEAVGKAEYKGKTYYFCCPPCEEQFNKDPEKYIGE